MLSRKMFARKFAETYNIPYYVADKYTRNFFEFLGDQVYKEGEDVVIPNFGSFRHKTAKPLTLKHPITQEPITKPARDFVSFVPNLELKKLHEELRGPIEE